MPLIRSLRLRAGRAILIAVVSSLFLSAATNVARAAPLSLNEWSHMIWVNAQDGDPSLAFELIERLPADHSSESVRDVRSAFEQRSRHLADAEADRQSRLAEAREAISKAADEGELAEALRSAIEMQTLSRSDQRTQIINDPLVAGLIEQAEEGAHAFEEKGEWMDAQELFLRLHLLFEEENRYREDIERVSRRLTMLRLYAPKRLHSMRNDHRIADGEDELPPFNEMGEDWREKLTGINRRMVVQALNKSHKEHVDGADMSKMIQGGLRAVRTLVTTHDLVNTFPGLKNESNVRKFVRTLDEQIADAAERGPRAGFYELTQSLDTVFRENKRTVDLSESVLLHEFGNGAMAELDNYSEVIWPDELRRFEKNTQGSFTGVGIQISMDEANQIVVVTPLEGTPAQRAGIKRDDIIRQVDGESTLGITTTQAVDRITGPKGTKVTLSVEREGAEELIDFDIVRDVIPIYSVKGWKRSGAAEDDWDWFIDPDNGIGYVRITQFTEQSTRELRRAIRQMKAKDVNGLILDLRFNPGGLLGEAVGVANVFVEEGVIVSQHDADGAVRDSQVARRSLTMAPDLPLVVLINEGSASASEIVAGCLQDYDKGLLVGARTFGKGSVQNVYAMGRRAALKLTTQYYRLPGGRLIHRRDGADEWGVNPDIVVDMLPHQINEALTLRQDADIMQVVGEQEWDVDERPDPERLLTEGIDPQLETALLLLRTQTLPKQGGTAMIDLEGALNDS